MSRLIDDLCEEQNVSKTSGILELKTRGPKCKTINIGKIKSRIQFSTEDLIRLKTSFSLSDKRILKLATCLRAALQSRKAVEPGLELALKDRNFILKDFYHMKMTCLSCVGQPCPPSVFSPVSYKSARSLLRTKCVLCLLFSFTHTC